MRYRDYLGKGLRVLLFEEGVISELGNATKATPFCILTVALIGIIAAIFSFDVDGLFILPVASVAIFFISAWLTHRIARSLGGTGTWERYYRPLGATYVLAWLVPFIPKAPLYHLMALWLLLVHLSILSRVHNISKLKAFFVFILSAIILAPVFAVLLPLVLLSSA